MVKIKYVEKKKLSPAFGLAQFDTKTVFVRKDLPKASQRFVLAHELYHIKDYANLKKKKKEYKIIWGEIKANFFALLKHPIGFLLTLILSLNPRRFKLYIDLYVTKKVKLEDMYKHLRPKKKKK